ncbi:unnamed protein product [Acanthoscelides obtectus]|uniref:Uncharacterized protein n=1 Tax=Acanthoscelides obtectus TaxID=200917 RepID=A0A9P0NZB4_ACAOB|nr:unnamed protein product [Acanthoscelides obtectus]CAK1663927.1 hypothetical protein AOBTE_LOCUS23935 [Acanthoscelides obtectus]
MGRRKCILCEVSSEKLRQPSTGFLVMRKNKKNGALSSILR